MKVMGHIHTKPGQHDHTISGFIIRTDGDEPKVLLHKHKKLEKLLQFGGHIELNEDPWQAVCHEILEESGYSMDQLKIMQPKTRIKYGAVHTKRHPYPVNYNTHKFNDEHFHIDISYAFITDEEPSHEIAEDESEDMMLLSRQQVIELTEKETYEDVKQICLFIFDEVLSKWEPVDTAEYN